MSNFHLRAKNKETSRPVFVEALDDYFGRHQYGYRLENGQILNEKDFWERFEEITD